MLPLSLLNATQGKPMLVELKSGETYNGHMVDCDTFMNVTLRDVYLTSPDGEKFWKLKEVYIRGNVIKYLRVADQILDQVQEDQLKYREQARGGNGPNRGGRGGRGGFNNSDRGGRGRGQ
ncbi:hypothetical protein HD553DRAFT_209973 [Filobasidium floriforme]|uniref:uncharacterized protein n=1 Tax=Filobasidium floriforme TaxID=5210 RepID=UPI001E8D32F5|nr:uncharacterized protein HD553DRAFT_209973 [Filobasidium floriforme]KAH8087025.1 hypothetical protein HD553DRAFT_209973 [Filobasidium floriforme]